MGSPSGHKHVLAACLHKPEWMMHDADGVMTPRCSEAESVSGLTRVCVSPCTASDASGSVPVERPYPFRACSPIVQRWGTVDVEDTGRISRPTPRLWCPLYPVRSWFTNAKIIILFFKLP